MIKKTNAARLLDSAHIPYELIPYEFDPEDLAAQHVADALGEDINQVFKTLVLHGTEKGHYFVCVIPGNCEVDLKKAAKVAGTKKADLIPMKELQPLTGYIRGGCSPIGLKKPFPIFLHQSALNFEHIFISAGQRGLQLKIAPQDLLTYTAATLADLTLQYGRASARPHRPAYSPWGCWQPLTINEQRSTSNEQRTTTNPK